MSTLSYPDAVRGLRAWVRMHDKHVQAAVELLIDHETWLRRAELVDSCAHKASGGIVWIDWSAARRAFNAGVFDKASSTELAVLDYAIALGENRFALSQMGVTNGRLLIEATAKALRIRIAGLS